MNFHTGLFSLKQRGGKNLSGRPVYGKGDCQVNVTTHNYVKRLPPK